jgi:methionine synthase II (cobalamin-independent)
MAGHLWPPGTATGIGSWPGLDVDEALRAVLGELPDLPYLPELPARGIGAELIGRGAAFLVDLPVEVQPSGWRITARPGRDLRRARDLLVRDLDTLQAQAEGHAGALKVQVAGPWTLAAGLELPSGHRVVSDDGATRDLAASLAEGLRAALSDLARRMPHSTVVLQLDEPSLPTVLAGKVPTPSGYGTVGAVEASRVEATLREVLDVAPPGGRVVHCCASDVPVALLRAAGADALSLDLALVESAGYDALGEAVDAGTSLWLGVVPAVDAEVTQAGARQRIERLWSALGFAPGRLASAVVPTPVCGLAGASPAYARQATAVVRDVGRALLDLTD